MSTAETKDAVRVEPEHTPGPWSVEYRDGRAAAMYGHHVHSNVYSRPGVSDGRDCICDVRGLTDQQSRANACLIAAAPILLALVKEAADDPDRCDCADNAESFPVYGGGYEGTFSGPCFHCRARAAITLAEGR